MAYSNAYHNYINSSEWFRRRKKFLKMADYECEWCGRFGVELQCHHLNYDNLFHEKKDDILVCCRPCHKWADRIRKHLKALPDSIAREKIKDRGYPFDMQRTTRAHVRKFCKDLKKLRKEVKAR